GDPQRPIQGRKTSRPHSASHKPSIGFPGRNRIAAKMITDRARRRMHGRENKARTIGQRSHERVRRCILRRYLVVTTSGRSGAAYGGYGAIVATALDSNELDDLLRRC